MSSLQKMLELRSSMLEKLALGWGGGGSQVYS